jgi:hypothetical protein
MRKYPGIVATAVTLLATMSATTIAGASEATGRQADTRSNHAASAPAMGANAVLQRAREAMGFSRVGDKIIHLHAVSGTSENYQSDRTYPPFFLQMQVIESWLDPKSGVERLSTQAVWPGSGPLPAQTTVDAAEITFAIRNDKPSALPRSSTQSRKLDAWAVIADWSAAADVRAAGVQTYRDYSRVVLSRKTEDGEQRLYLDAKTGFPVKLDLQESHYLWGQRHIEYVYSNWNQVGAISIPSTAFRLADGVVEISETVGDTELVDRGSAPSLALPDSPQQAPAKLPMFLQPIAPKTVQVGPNTYLLTNPGYTEAVTLVGDTVYIFDATQGEDRARQDAELIHKLFPGEHKINVVVTDLAWPHVAGLRYWVASGATVLAHSATREFLQSVIDRRWTLAPDLLEQRRKTAKLKFIGIDASYSVAGGKISIHPIDGIGSEVALMAYLEADHFLWASDYIQDVSKPTLYASEVWKAVRRVGIQPERVAAEHLAITPWKTIEALQVEAAGTQGGT